MGGGEGGVEESFSYGGLSSWFKVQRFMDQGEWFMCKVQGLRCMV